MTKEKGGKQSTPVKPATTTTPAEKPKLPESIETDSDFDRYGLEDIPYEELEKIPDNRKSGWHKLTWTQVIQRVLLWMVVVYINHHGYLDPWSPNCVYKEVKNHHFHPYMDWFFLPERPWFKHNPLWNKN